MVIRRKSKKIDMRIKDGSVEQVESFKYFGCNCNINSSLNCCQEVKPRIAMTKEAFNRKRRIFCGPLDKELRKRLVKCFLWSCAETWALRRNEQKRLEAFEMWIWRRMERVKWTYKTKNTVMLERGGRMQNNAGNDKEKEKKLAGPLAQKELPAEGCFRTAFHTL